ncbi:hypothetical protein TTHERM_00198280 (macronuclear) [Tetrahymena thermophila SB210]|uniref:Uncharacterized protein n=1 Tax=Tetrahymena thermophila (strain SB210) TaxID=312017 RepID=Q22NM1_TETTS|nr:hypothetical protein TTHERM_00198280 [Tetrahymena thermophila SB210]EAR86764.1 hypothetical protein TTHERM_00198280 [Tetrahymena thermophila SB210]|eukprot:XP_001007009.1 hypothetical protein TTHERM_00198280 [Tetrahymena thermophila SB210]
MQEVYRLAQVETSVLFLVVGSIIKVVKQALAQFKQELKLPLLDVQKIQFEQATAAQIQVVYIQLGVFIAEIQFNEVQRAEKLIQEGVSTHWIAFKAIIANKRGLSYYFFIQFIIFRNLQQIQNKQVLNFELVIDQQQKRFEINNYFNKMGIFKSLSTQFKVF